MKKRKLGVLEVSAIGMGCMGFTHAYGETPSESDGIALVHKAFELGCNFFDTAEMYSYFKSEEFVGKALKELQIAFCSVAMQICFEYMSAGEVAMLNYTMPIWVTILAKFFLNEPLTAKKILGVTLSIAGIFILMNDDLSGNLFAILLALTAAMGWAVSNILMKIKFVGFNLISLTTWQMVAGAIILSVYCACFVDTTAIWTPLSIACIAYNGILASALAFFLWMYILSRTQASKASVSILGVPVVGVISGVIFLQEPLTVLMSVGIIMILLGIVLVQRS